MPKRRKRASKPKGAETIRSTARNPMLDVASKYGLSPEEFAGMTATEREAFLSARRAPAEDFERSRMPEPAELLAFEKRRRGLRPESVLFVGMHNVAEFWWCAMKSVLDSRKNEHLFFDAYLEDRRDLAGRLGEKPSYSIRPEDSLDVGKALTVKDASAVYLSHNFVQEKKKALAGKWAKYVKNVQLPSLSEPFAAGIAAQRTLAEKYPTFRWGFDTGRFVLVGVPDGIGSDLVYEFKTCGNKFFSYFTVPVALRQADFYGVYFERRRKRVQVYVRDTAEMITKDEPVEPDMVNETLRKFAEVDAGRVPSPPKPWKCKNCEYRETCPSLNSSLAGN